MDVFFCSSVCRLGLLGRFGFDDPFFGKTATETNALLVGWFDCLACLLW